MQPAVAEKGLMVLDCIALGKAGHAARNEGVNAILLAMKDIEWFTTYQFPEKSDFLGPVKMSVTVIHAGSQHNVIPDRCEFTVDIRTNEFYTNEALFNHIKQHIDSEVKARSFRLNSSRTEVTHPFVQRAILLGKEPSVSSLSGPGTDAVPFGQNPDRESPAARIQRTNLFVLPK